jgi:DNA repair exonuclease SbcCD ATPase subunit
MSYTHVIHIGDIHIRIGNEECARVQEYTSVFKRLATDLAKLPCIQNNAALIVVCGDVFHNKNKLEPHTVKLWNRLMKALTSMAPVAIICGNHDYRQEAPHAPDLIDVLMNSWGDSAYPCTYLKDTGVYNFNNIDIGLVCIKDTLNSLSTSGMIADLPEFPMPNESSKATTKIALFHGTITQSALPNGQLMAAGKGYPLEWFKGYDIVMLGDNHKQQVNKSAWGMPWAYPGSLVQQDIGEPVQGHGYILWNVETRTGTAHHIYNTYGRMKARLKDGGLQVRVDHMHYVPIENVAYLPWFPKQPCIAVIGNIGVEVPIAAILSNYGIKPCELKTTAMLANEIMEGDGNTEAEDATNVDGLVAEIANLNNPQRWLEYIKTKDADLGQSIANMQWMENPEKMIMDVVPMSLNAATELVTTVNNTRMKLQDLCSTHQRISAQVGNTTSKVTLKHMRWSWVFSYGQHNWFSFETMEGKIGILNGPNASGKSSFIDALCIGLFGEPNPNRQMNSSKKMSGHFIHNQRPAGGASSAMHVDIIMEVDGTEYELIRKFGVQTDKSESKVLNADLYKIEVEDNRRIRSNYKSGSTTVNEWVGEHCGTIDDVLKTSIVTQMDNNNFFFAKADEQKHIIDHAVNLNALQSFGNIVHEALLGHNTIIKMVSTMIGTSQLTIKNELISTEEEIDAYKKERERLQHQINTGEQERDSLAAQAGVFIDNPPTLSLKDLQNKLLTYPAYTFAPPFANANSEKQKLIDRLTLIHHLIKAITNIPSTFTMNNHDLDEESADIDHLKDTEATMAFAYESHIAKKPYGARPIDTIMHNLQLLNVWFDDHDEWLKTPGAAKKELKRALMAQHDTENAYEEWASQKVERVDLDNDEEAHDGLTWQSKVDAFSIIKAKFDKNKQKYAIHISNTITPERTKDKESRWIEELTKYEETVSVCEQNEWTDSSQCKDNAAQTRAYLVKRKECEGTLAREQAECDRRNVECSLHPNWTVEKYAWECSAKRFGDIDTATLKMQITELRQQLEQRTQIDQFIQKSTEALEDMHSDGWDTEWATWKARLARAEKHNWRNTNVLLEQLQSFEDKHMSHRLLTTQLVVLQKENLELQSCPFNDTCNACRANPMHIRRHKIAADIEQITQDLVDLGSLEEIDKVRTYLRKGIDCITYIDAHRQEVERKHSERTKAIKDHEQVVLQNKRLLTKIPLRLEIEEALEKAISKHEAFTLFQARSVMLSAKFERLEALNAEMVAFEATVAKLKKKLDRMQTEEELLSTLEYWESGVKATSFIELHKEHIERECAAWETARKQWVAQEAWNIMKEQLEAGIAKMENDIVAVHKAAYAAWLQAGVGIQVQRTTTHERIAKIESFIANVEEKRTLHTALIAEQELSNSFVEWEAQEKLLKTELHTTRYRLYKLESADLEAKLTAIGSMEDGIQKHARTKAAIAWYEYQALKETLISWNARLFHICGIIDQHDRDASRYGNQERTLATLNQLWNDWSRRRDLLTKLDERLVGERGRGKGVGSTGTDTFKEWVYVSYVLPMIERRVNRFLMDIDDIRLCITYRAKNLQYSVIDRGNETSFAASSGYQQFVIGLAMRQALAAVGGAGNNLQHMFIDEGFTACDAQNIEKAHDVLRLLIGMGKYKSILLVTHLDSIKEAIPLKINIVRDNSFSKLCYGSEYPVFDAGVPRRGRPRRVVAV